MKCDISRGWFADLSSELSLEAPTVADGPPPAWRAAVRTAAFGWIELLARRQYGLLADRTGWGSAG